uniref:Spermine synthase n=1 Tax=Acrobeloides nanus TaxID=290746 RepID=A0A914EMD6_9BILA
MCSQLMNNMCYIVVDYEIENVYSRSILVNTLVDAKLSIADLIKSENEKFTLQNSANWKINHYRLHKPYLKAMSIAPFLTDTIQKETKNPSILLIGVAGATLNNFYHEMPNEPIIIGVELDSIMVDVAEKWFGLKKSNRHKILVEDGVKFFKDREQNAEKYDAIFVDACQTDHDDELHCPIYEFRIEDMAYHVHRSLAENGTLAINVLSLNNTISAYDKILNVYRSYFPTCFFLSAQNGDWMNRVLVATNNPNININQEEFIRKLHENMPEIFFKSNDFKVDLIV